MKRKLTPALGYVRVSGKGQAAEDRDGLRRQRENVERFAKRANYEILEWYEDPGVSGTTELENRPGLESAATRIAGNGVKVMLIENSDRLARDLMVQEIIIKEFLTMKAQIITADGYDLTADDESRVFVRQVLGAASQFSKSLLVRRMRDARRKKKAEGKRVEGRKPFGSRPGEDKALQRMKELRHKPKRGDRLSFAQIAEKLTAEGFTTRTGKPWAAQVVGRILRREKGQATAP